MGSIEWVDRAFVNGDIKLMALEMISQACAIRDEDPDASVRRAHLLRASSHLLSAFAELEELPDR